MRHGAAAAFALALTGVLAACATAPVEEIRQFKSSLDNLDGAATPLLDDLAVAERQNWQRIRALEARAGDAGGAAGECTAQGISGPDGLVLVSSFCGDDARYISALDDPPATARLRRGIGTVNAFSTALVALVDGSHAEAGADEVIRLGSEITGLLGAAGAGPAGAGANMVLGGNVLAPLRPIVDRLAVIADHAQAKELILENEAAVGGLIDGLEAAVPKVFNLLIANDVVKWARQGPGLPVAEAEADIARVEGYRRLLADYALLLDRSRRAWHAAVGAARTETPVSIGSLAGLAGEIRKDAEAVRRSQAEFRTRPR